MDEQNTHTTNGANHSTGNEPVARSEDEVSLLDLLLVLVRNRRLIVMVTGVFVLCGLTYAVLAPLEYTSSARVVREAESNTQSGLGGLGALRGLGINLGGASSGLTTEAYPVLLKSREVRLGVVRDTFRIAPDVPPMTLVEYFNQPSGILGTVIGGVKTYTIGLPGLLLNDAEPERPAVADTVGGGVAYPTKDEEDAIQAVEGMVTTFTDSDTGIMTVSATAGDPVLAASIVESFIEHLTERVRAIRTEKARQNLVFIQDRFETAKEDLQEAEERLAQFADRNRQLGTAQLETERNRLQRRVQFAKDYYSELQTQVTQAEIDLQRSQPVITVVERPVPPLIRSAPRRTLIVLMSLVLGFFIALGIAFVRAFVSAPPDSVEERDKLNEVREAFALPALLQRFTAKRTQEASVSPPNKR